MIHLDTNFLIDSLVSGSSQEAKLAEWLSAGERVSISAVAWGEFLCGPLPPAAEQLARQLLPAVEILTGTDAERAASIFNQTGRRSKTFSDCCIAAIAMRSGARLATSNHADFKRMQSFGLMLI